MIRSDRLTSSKINQGNRIALHYTDLLLDTIRDASGRSLVLLYADDKLAALADSEGDSLVQYRHNQTSGLLEEVRYDGGSWEKYAYGENSWDAQRLVSASNSDGVTHSYSYDSSGLAIEYSLATGSERVQLSYEYINSDGCPPGSTLVYVVQADSSYYSATFSPDHTLRHIHTRLDASCADCPTNFEYGGHGKISKVTYANGTEHRFWYDSRGNLLRSALGNNTSYPQVTSYENHTQYHRSTRQSSPSIANLADSARTFFHYNELGHVDTLIETGWIDANSEFSDTTVLAYNAAGQLSSVDGPRPGSGDSVSFAYYGNGDLHYEVLPNGDTTEYGLRDLLGRQTWIRSPNGDTTRSFFDTRGNLITLIRRAGSADSIATIYSYNFVGELAAVNTVAGTGVSISFDSSGYIDTVKNNNGDFIVYRHDSLGHKTAEDIFKTDSIWYRVDLRPGAFSQTYSNDTLSDTLPGGPPDTTVYQGPDSILYVQPRLRKTEQYRYNRRGELVAQFDSSGDSTLFEYDAVGNLTTITDALGRVSLFEYDSLSRMIRQIHVESADSFTTSYSYDAADNLTKVVDPDGYEYVYRYDDKGRTIFDSCGATGTSRFGYDPANNLTWMVNAAGDSVIYEYDLVNRITAVLYPDSQNVYYEYDGTMYEYGRGRLYRETGPACATTYRYDAHGRLIRESRQFSTDSATYITEYGYDQGSNLQTLTYPSGSMVTYIYDAEENVVAVTLTQGSVTDTLLVDGRYAPFGEMESWRLGNGLVLTNRYNTDFLLDSISTGADQLFELLYTYSSVQNLTQISDLLDTTRTAEFAYDALGQLTEARSASYPDSLIQIRYSANGNRDTLITFDSTGVSTETYTYSSNRLVQVTGSDAATFEYDPLGRVTAIRTPE